MNKPTASVGRHPSALRSGLRFLLLWVFRHLLAIAYAIARMTQLSYVAYRQLRADFINLPFTPACAFFRLSNQRFVRSLSLTTAVIDSYGQISSICPSLRLALFSACQIKDLSVRCRSQRRLSTVTGRFHQSALHSGLRFLSKV